MGYSRGTRGQRPWPLRLWFLDSYRRITWDVGNAEAQTYWILTCCLTRAPDDSLHIKLEKQCPWQWKLLWPVVYGQKWKREPPWIFKNMNLKTVKSCCNFKLGASFESILNSIHWLFKKSNIFYRAWYISLFSVSQ